MSMKRLDWSKRSSTPTTLRSSQYIFFRLDHSPTLLALCLTHLFLLLTCLHAFHLFHHRTYERTNSAAVIRKRDGLSRDYCEVRIPVGTIPVTQRTTPEGLIFLISYPCECWSIGYQLSPVSLNRWCRSTRTPMSFSVWSKSLLGRTQSRRLSESPMPVEKDRMRKIKCTSRVTTWIIISWAMSSSKSSMPSMNSEWRLSKTNGSSRNNSSSSISRSRHFKMKRSTQCKNDSSSKEWSMSWNSETKNSRRWRYRRQRINVLRNNPKTLLNLIGNSEVIGSGISSEPIFCQNKTSWKERHRK